MHEAFGNLIEFACPILGFGIVFLGLWMIAAIAAERDQ